MTTLVIPKNDFFQKVYTVTRQIPKGRVTSYGAIAAFLSIKGASRMVGWALNYSHAVLPFIPAHRVVNRQGILTGKSHFGTPTFMQQLLENEGVIVHDDKIQNFSLIFWDPSLELN